MKLSKESSFQFGDGSVEFQPNFLFMILENYDQFPLREGPCDRGE
jgi:hypothetical protein